MIGFNLLIAAVLAFFVHPWAATGWLFASFGAYALGTYVHEHRGAIYCHYYRWQAKYILVMSWLRRKTSTFRHLD